MQSIRNTNKAQASIEMMIAIGTVLVIFVFMLFFAYHIYKEKGTAGEQADAENLCIRISSIVSGLYLSGAGSEMDISTDYNITFEAGRSIFIMLEDGEVFCTSSIGLTNGTDDTFMMQKGILSFKNINGLVVVEEIS